MLKEVCNMSHLKNISHIDVLSTTLVCPSDFPLYLANGAKLIPIMDYAN